MKPLPAQDSIYPKHSAPGGNGIPSLPETLSIAATSHQKPNRRAATCATQRAYPWLLVASTAIAGAFCTLYITKPVIVASPSFPTISKVSAVLPPLPVIKAPPSLMPNPDHLPGEKAAAQPNPATDLKAQPPGPLAAVFEQTNLRIQHIRTAQAPGGHLAKIDFDVPVLYQSRSLRWTPTEVAEARALMIRLQDYQEKAGALRSEGTELLTAWNQLVEKSIPTSVLRADSPALPANQHDTADSPSSADLDSSELIQIQPAKK